jgi:hypothetical protein
MTSHNKEKSKFYSTKPARIFVQVVLICAGIAGILHFGYAVWEWKHIIHAESGYRVSANIHQDWYIDAMPTAILLSASICILIAGLRRKMGGLLILLWALISTFIFFQYDLSNQNWQVRTTFPWISSSLHQYHYANWPYYKLKRNNKHWGYIDRTGEYVIKPRFKSLGKFSSLFSPVNSFSEGLAPANDGRAWGFINKTGEYVIEPQFSNVSQFSEGLAIASSRSKSGIIDKTGKFILEPMYKEIESFSQGRAVFQIKTTKYEYADPNDTFDMREPDSNGMVGKSVNKYGYLDSEGNVVVEPMYDYANPFSEGIAGVDLDGKVMLIDRDGNIILKKDFPRMKKFSEGLAVFYHKDGKCGYIDRTGQIVIENQYDYAYEFKNGYAQICQKTGNIYKSGLIDKTGNLVIAPKYEGLTDVRNGKLWAGLNRKAVHLDVKGNVLKHSDLGYIGRFQEGLASFHNGRKYGFVDESGKTVIKAKYNDVRDFSEGLAAVSILKNAIPFRLAYGAVIGMGILLFLLHKLIQKRGFLK